LENLDEHIERLIVRYFSGEALPEEAIELDEWVDLSPENRKYFEEYRFIHQNTATEKRFIKVDTARGWDNVSRQMKPSARPSIQRVKAALPFYKKSWVRIAASLLLLTGISLLLILYNRSENTILLPPTELTSNDSIVTRQIAPTISTAINKNTTIACSADRSGKKNEIRVSGEAYFDIRHSKDTSVVVKADETLIRDIGTSFNVRAYPSDDVVKVFVENGKVEFSTSENNGIIVSQGETGVYNKKEKKFALVIESDPNITAYKTRIFVFRNNSLPEVARILNNVYPKRLILADNDLADQKITVTFKNESIDSIAEVIAETLSLKVERDSTAIILSHE